MKLFLITWSGLNKKGVRKIRTQKVFAWDADEAYRGWHMYSKDGDELVSIERM